MMGSTCPYCGADTRPGDNFCLNCGNRLLTGTPSSQQQAEPAVGESTLLAQDGGASSVQDQGSQPVSSGANWSDAAPTIASSNSGSELPTTFAQHDAQSVGQAPSTASATIERPAKFILRADNGDVLQEYVLEKPEISIGRAPNSDILLSKDKLTSRRHATVSYENGKYVLHDERSANGTFVNGQQLEEMATYDLQEGDHVGIGEHELIFRDFGSSASTSDNVSDMPTVAVQYNPNQELTYRTQEDEHATSGTGDDFSTKSMANQPPSKRLRQPQKKRRRHLFHLLPRLLPWQRQQALLLLNRLLHPVRRLQRRICRSRLIISHIFLSLLCLISLR
jgi:FHA domain